MNQKHIFMDEAMWQEVQSWGAQQRPPLNASQALRTLVRRALDWEHLKEPGAYLEAWRKRPQAGQKGTEE